MEDGIMEWLLSMKYGSPEEREKKRLMEEQAAIAMAQQQQGQPQGTYGDMGRGVSDLIRQRRQAEENALLGY